MPGKLGLALLTLLAGAQSSQLNEQEDSVNNSGTFEVPTTLDLTGDAGLIQAQEAFESLLDSQTLAFKSDESGLERKSEEMMEQAHRFLEEANWVKLDIVVRAGKGPEEVARRVAFRRGRLLREWFIARGIDAQRIRVGIILPSESAEKLKGVRARPIHFFARR